MKNDEQLELGFSRDDFAGGRPARQRRLDRARWWFGQMRATVDRTVTWPPVAPPPSRQKSVIV